MVGVRLVRRLMPVAPSSLFVRARARAPWVPMMYRSPFSSEAKQKQDVGSYAERIAEIEGLRAKKPVNLRGGTLYIRVLPCPLLCSYGEPRHLKKYLRGQKERGCTPNAHNFSERRRDHEAILWENWGARGTKGLCDVFFGIFYCSVAHTLTSPQLACYAIGTWWAMGCHAWG